MSLLSGIGSMSSGAYGNDEPCEKASSLKNKQPIGRFPKFCYNLFFNNNADFREKYLSWQEEKILIKFIESLQNKEIKKEAYVALKNKSFKDVQNRSKVVQEIAGICSFADALGRYFKTSLKAYLDK